MSSQLNIKYVKEKSNYSSIIEETQEDQYVALKKNSNFKISNYSIYDTIYLPLIEHLLTLLIMHLFHQTFLRYYLMKNRDKL